MNNQKTPCNSSLQLLGFLFVLGAINFADKSIIGLAAAPMMGAFRLSAQQWGILGGSFYWLFSLSSILVMPWSDRIGPRRLLPLLSLTWAVAQGIMPWVGSFIGLLVARAVLGAGEGPSYAASAHAVSRELPAERRGIGLATITLGSAIGPAILAPALSVIIVRAGWQVAFLLLAVLGIIWTVLWWWWSWRTPSLSSPIPMSGTTRKRQEQKQWRRLFAWLATPHIASTVLAGFAAYWYLALLTTWMPLYLQNARHLQATQPLYLLGISLPWLAGGGLQLGIGLLADRLFRRYRVYWPLLVGVELVGAVLLIMAVLVSSPLLSILCFAACPLAAVFPIVASILAHWSPAEQQGNRQGASVGLYALAGLLAPTVTGGLIQRLGNTRGFLLTFLLTSLLLIIAAVAIWIGARFAPRQAEATVSNIQASTC